MTFSAYKEYFIYILLGIALAFGLYGLTVSPLPWTDEILYADPIRHLAEGNGLKTDIFFHLRSLDVKFFLQMPVYFYVQAGFVKLFGYSQTLIRLVNLIFYILTIFLIYRIVRRITGDIPGSEIFSLIAPFLFAFDKSVLESVRSGRVDALAIFFMIFALFCASKRPISFLSLAGGVVFSILAAFTHGTMVFIALAMQIYILILCIKKDLDIRTYGLLIGVAVLTSLPYVIDVVSHFSIWRNQFFGLTSNVVNGVALPFMDIAENYGKAFMFIPTYFLLWLSIRIKDIRWRIADPLILFFLGMLISTFAMRENHIKFLLPLLFIITNIFLIRYPYAIGGTKRKIIGTMIGGALIINFLSFPVLRAATIFLEYDIRDPLARDQFVAKNIPTGSRVLSEAPFYYSLVSRGIAFRYPFPMAYVNTDLRDGEAELFQKEVIKFRPEYLILHKTMNPAVYFSYLPVKSFALADNLAIKGNSRLNFGNPSDIWSFNLYRVVWD